MDKIVVDKNGPIFFWLITYLTVPDICSIQMIKWRKKGTNNWCIMWQYLHCTKESHCISVISMTGVSNQKWGSLVKFITHHLKGTSTYLRVTVLKKVSVDSSSNQLLLGEIFFLFWLDFTESVNVICINTAPRRKCIYCHKMRVRS